MCRGNLVRREIEIIYCERYFESEKEIYLSGVPVGESEGNCVVDLVAKLASSTSLARDWVTSPSRVLISLLASVYGGWGWCCYLGFILSGFAIV